MSGESVHVRCGNCLMLNRVPRERLESRPACGNCTAALEVPREPVWARVENFDRAVAYWPETLLLMFTAPMCLYCRIYEPVVNDLAGKQAGKLKVMKVDTSIDEYLTQRFKVTETPTFIVYRSGEELIRVDGAPKDKTDLVTWVENLLNYTRG